MKKFIGVLAINAAMTLVAASAHAATIQTAQQPAAAQGQCTDESKAAWYADFTKFRTTDAKQAYEAGKKYLAACPTEEGQIPTYLKKWVAAYEKEARKLKLTPMLYGEKKYVEALALGKEVLTDEPE